MADILDILTAAEARTALNAVSNWNAQDTPELEQVVTAASRFVDSVFGPVVTRSVTRTVFSPSGPIALDVPPGSPTFTVSSLAVTEYTAGSATVLAAETALVSTSNDYRYDSRLGLLRRRASWSNSSWGSQEVLVVYIAGRYASTAACDAKFKEAAAAALIHFWQHRGPSSGFPAASGDGAPFGGVPFSTAQLRVKLRSMMPEEALGPVLA